jgi:hypothetical protein
MSGLSMRTRISTVVVGAAIVAPFALAGGSAHAATDVPAVGNVTAPVSGILGGVLSTTGGGLLGTATGTATNTGLPTDGLLGSVDPMNTSAGGATDVVSSTLGSVLGTDVLSTVTNVADLEGVLSTVTNLVDIPKIIKTVTDLVGDVTKALNLDDLLKLPVKILNPGEVKGATKAKAAKAKSAAVEAGALPHTGGNADMTAMLLCAGLGVAGTGVTLVTRRRNSLLAA